MPGEKAVRPKSSGAVPDLRWRGVLAGYALAVLFTMAVGWPLLMVRDSTWSLAVMGSVGLLGGGLLTGRRVQPQVAPLNGALLAILYNLSVAVFFFIGSILQLLPEPLPGLPQGDSTFFFAWPLAQFVVAIVGVTIGSRTSAKRKEGE